MSTTRWRPALAIVANAAAATALLFSPPALAAEPARLVYVRGEGASTCPNEATLRQAIAARIGFDPFGARDGERSREVRVIIDRRGSRLAAIVEVRDEDGALAGERSIESQGSSCDELASAVVVTVSVALDPSASRARPPSPPPPSQTKDQTPDTEADAKPPPPPPSSGGQRVAWYLAAGAGLGLGVAPSPSMALGAALGARVGALGLELEGRAQLPAGTDDGPWHLSASSGWLSLAPCVYARWLGACALGSAGVLWAESSSAAVHTTASTFVSAAGIRAFVELPFAESFALRLGSDVLATLRGARLVVDGREGWASAPFEALFFVTGRLKLP